MTEDNKNFTATAPMLFGEEFTKQATTTVEQIKAMKKLTITLEKRVFPNTTPKVITAAVGVGPRVAMRDTTHTEEARQGSPPPAQFKATIQGTEPSGRRGVEDSLQPLRLDD